MSIADSTGCASTRRPVPTPAVADRSTPETRLRDERWLKVMRTFNMTVAETADFLTKPYRTVARGIESALRREAQAEAQAAAAAAAAVAPAAEDLAALVEPDADLTPEERAALAASSLDLDDLVDFRDRYQPGTKLGDNPVVRNFFRQIKLDALIARKRVGRREPRPTLVTNTLSAGVAG